MNMDRGVDASMDCAPYIGTLRSLGVGFVGRYYCNLALTNNPAKVLTPREAHSLCDAGFSIITVWEYLNTPGYFSGSQGLADGDYAYKYAAEVIHQPENSAIYFAVDFDASETQFRQLIAPYFQGVNQAFANVGNNRPLYSVGAYGSGAVIAALKQSGLAQFGWLANASGWQGSRGYNDWDVEQGPEIVQQLPFRYDENVAKEKFGGFQLAFENNTNLFSLAIPSKVVKAKALSKKRSPRKRRRRIADRA
jgi:hypothetical protein